MRIIKSSEYIVVKHIGTLDKHHFKRTESNRCIISNFVMLYFHVALKYKQINKNKKCNYKFKN